MEEKLETSARLHRILNEPRAGEKDLPLSSLGGDMENQNFATPSALRDFTEEPNEDRPRFLGRKKRAA
jgi:hypothetical protein